MLRKSKRHPNIPMSHPAVSLREDHVPALQISKTEFARALGISRQTLYDLLDERQGITANIALRLEKVIGGSAEFWLNRQMAYDLWRTRREVDVSKLRRLRAPADDTLEAAE